jgi:hypothetical protein
VQARVVGGMLVAGESAYIELQLKNHSAKKVRHLFYPAILTFLWLIVPDRRRASMSRSAAIYIYRRQPMALVGASLPLYRSPILSQTSPSVGPSTLPIRALRVSHNLCSTSHAPPAPSRRIRGTAAT